MLDASLRLMNNRGRTALVRNQLSRPLRFAIDDGLIANESLICDYGCGRGDDIRHLIALGYNAIGWDPIHRPHTTPMRAPIVNLGYVVNVIEDVDERREVLHRAWELAQKLLIVSARLGLDRRRLRDSRDFSDGCITSRGTFQKFFNQRELREWIERILNVNATSAAPGIFYVFRDEHTRSRFIASRYRRRSSTTRLAKSASLFAANLRLVEPLIKFVNDRGRLPFDDELENAYEIVSKFGSVRRAFRVVFTVTNDGRWEQVRRERKQDLLVYLALSRFDGRLPFGQLPLELQRDVRAFFGFYKRGCAAADELLWSRRGRGFSWPARRSRCSLQAVRNRKANPKRTLRSRKRARGLFSSAKAL